MVASNSAVAASLADVLPSCFGALGVEGFSDRFSLGSPSRIVLFLVDGLGLSNIECARGYARFLSTCPSLGELTTVFPSTTASALASLATGAPPTAHGILGYRVWNPERGELVNQLNGIDDREVDGGWLNVPSLIGAAKADRMGVSVIGHQRYRSSALTRLIYTDARYIGVSSMSESFSALSAHLAEKSTGVTLVYLSQLDECAHRSGVNSYEWTALLEELDSELREFARACPSDVCAILTADHGVIDVPAAAHREFGLGDELTGVRAIGGEPRCLQVYLHDAVDRQAVSERWGALAGDNALVMSPEQVEDLVWKATISDSLRGRIPDLYVFAPTGEAWYDGREPTSPARNMVGQHGGLSEQECRIPLLRVSLG
jgi:hypothetical protein